jgi:hypothetical protein
VTLPAAGAKPPPEWGACRQTAGVPPATWAPPPALSERIRAFMIELRELPTEGLPPRPVRHFDSEVDLIREFGFALNEIEDALKNGTCLRGKHTLDLAPGFLRMVIGDPAFSGVLPERIWHALVEELRDAAINEIASKNIFGIGRDEIKKTIGISDHALRQNISRAIKKIGREPLKRLASALHEYRQIKYRRDIQVVKRTKITITFKSE